MSGPRFEVGTVTGHLTDRKGDERKPPGMSAHVFDTLHLHRVVATFRTEETRAHTVELRERRVLWRAQQEANRLNAEDMAERG